MNNNTPTHWSVQLEELFNTMNFSGKAWKGTAIEGYCEGAKDLFEDDGLKYTDDDIKKSTLDSLTDNLHDMMQDDAIALLIDLAQDIQKGAFKPTWKVVEIDQDTIDHNEQLRNEG